MSKGLDLVGRRVGLLTVQSRSDIKVSNRAAWLCLCDCGNTRLVPTAWLKCGSCVSCGCRRGAPTHGQSRSRLYKVWCGMWARCNSKDEARYGGRGITVSERWQSFENFRDDMGQGYAKGLQIDRIDNDGNYEPGNCRWATRIENSRNKCDNRIVLYGGEPMTAMEASERSGLNKWTVLNRAQAGLTEETGLFAPPSRVYGQRLLTAFGETKNISAWAKQLGISPNSLAARLERRWPLEIALTAKPGTGQRGTRA